MRRSYRFPSCNVYHNLPSSFAYVSALFQLTVEICVSDKNECVDGSTCGQNAECVNTEGSYMCVCEYGYNGDGQDCTLVCPREYAYTRAS